MTDARDHALAGYRLGFSFTPLDGKRPIQQGWSERDRPVWPEICSWLDDGCNLGLRTGRASGITVIDLDGPATEVAYYLPATMHVVTGSGGIHLYYAHRGNLNNSRGKLLSPLTGRPMPDVDVRGDGGQVVYPGSLHPETQSLYMWGEQKPQSLHDFAPFPRHLLPKEHVPRRPVLAPQINSDVAKKRAWRYAETCPRSVAGGNGHGQFFAVACRAWDFGLHESEVRELLHWFSANKSDPPWADHEIEHKLKSSRSKAKNV